MGLLLMSTRPLNEFGIPWYCISVNTYSYHRSEVHEKSSYQQQEPTTTTSSSNLHSNCKCWKKNNILYLQNHLLSQTHCIHYTMESLSKKHHLYISLSSFLVFSLFMVHGVLLRPASHDEEPDRSEPFGVHLLSSWFNGIPASAG